MAMTSASSNSISGAVRGSHPQWDTLPDRSHAVAVGRTTEPIESAGVRRDQWRRPSVACLHEVSPSCAGPGPDRARRRDHRCRADGSRSRLRTPLGAARRSRTRSAHRRAHPPRRLLVDRRRATTRRRFVVAGDMARRASLRIGGPAEPEAREARLHTLDGRLVEVAAPDEAPGFGIVRLTGVEALADAAEEIDYARRSLTGGGGPRASASVLSSSLPEGRSAT